MKMTKNELAYHTSLKYAMKLEEYCNGNDTKAIDYLLSKLKENPNILPYDFYIVDKKNFDYCVIAMRHAMFDYWDEISYLSRFTNAFNSYYRIAKEEQEHYNNLLLRRKNATLPNKKKFIIELKSIFDKINLEGYSKEKIYNIILKHYDLFPYDFDIVDVFIFASCIDYSVKSKSRKEEYDWKNIVNLLEKFNNYYIEEKHMIELHKKRDDTSVVSINFDGYIVHLKANELEELDKVDKNNPAAIENIKHRYKEELKKCNILLDSIISLYDNLDDFKKIDPFIVYDTINKVTSIKEFYDIPFTYLVEIFKEEFKKNKENNFTTSEIISKLKKITPEALEKVRNQQKQEAFEKYIEEIIKRNEQIDKYNRDKSNEHQEQISNISSGIDKLKEEIKKKQEELKTLENQLEEVKKQEVKYELKMINEEMLFNWCEDYFEIKNEYINHLNEYDLSSIRWDNVKVSGIDFSITNAELNPQEVYKKDISNCKFKDANLRDLNINYTGVDLRGTDIREEISMPGVEHSIYDENTKFSNEIINYLTDLGIYNYNSQNKTL